MMRAARDGLPGRAAGFTMTELVVTLSIAAILTAIALPSFSSITANQRAKVCASELFSSIAKTRAEAITLNGNVTLNAAAGGWGNGWQMVDPNGNALDNQSAAQGVTVTGPNAVTYTPSGRLPAGTPAPVFVISTVSGGVPVYQCVSVNLSGRPYMKPASTC